MTEVHGDDGELVQRLIEVLTELPELLVLDLSTYIALAVGGEAMSWRPRPTGVVPPAGTIAAADFIDGNTLEVGAYNQLLAKRLHELCAAGMREDVLIRAVLGEVTRRLAGLTDVKAGNAARAGMLRQLIESGAEVSRSIRDRLQPMTQAEIDDHEADLSLWTCAQSKALPDALLDEWMHLALRRS